MDVYSNAKVNIHSKQMWMSNQFVLQRVLVIDLLVLVLFQRLARIWSPLVKRL